MTNNKNVIHNKNKYVEIFINYKNKLVITAPPIHPFTVIKPLYLESINNVELLELLDDGNIKTVYYIRDKYNNIIDHKINIYSSLNQIFNM